MQELYNLIVDSIVLPNGLEFFYPIIFIVLLIVVSMFVFAIIDKFINVFKR